MAGKLPPKFLWHGKLTLSLLSDVVERDAWCQFELFPVPPRHPYRSRHALEQPLLRALLAQVDQRAIQLFLLEEGGIGDLRAYSENPRSLGDAQRRVVHSSDARAQPALTPGEAAEGIDLSQGEAGFTLATISSGEET